MSKILEQSKARLIKVEQRTKINFRNKPITIRSLYQQFSQSHKSSSHEEKPPSPENIRVNQPSQSPEREGQAVLDQTCSNFMRNYIDKLKKQRKREKKKVDQSSHSKQGETGLGCELASLPSIPHGKAKLFSSRRIHPLSFRSNSVVQSEGPQTPEIDHLISMIKEVRAQERPHHRRNFSQGLPTLKRGRQEQRIESVDPWDNSVDYQQMAFEQYK